MHLFRLPKMEKSIVLQLQTLASDQEANIEELLRKALLVSSKLNFDDFEEWCKSELEGYDSIDQLPDYRIVTGELKFLNPSLGYIPFTGNLGNVINEICTSKCIQPLSYFTNLLESNEGSTLTKRLPDDIQSIFNDIQYKQHRRMLGGNLYISGMDNFFTPFLGYVIYGKSQFLNIFSEIRNKILIWSTELEKKGILGEGLEFSVKERVAAMSVNNFNIQNMQGVAGNVSGGTINQNNQMSIEKMDFDSLAKHLMQNKVEFSDIQALKEAIDHDPVPEASNRLGNNVSGWIAGMVGKAATGTWGISIGAAGTLLAEAISKYYGLG